MSLVSHVSNLASRVATEIKAVRALVTTTTSGMMSAADKVKLNGIATGATANDTDANLKNRANHTGSQAISTVTGLQTAIDAKVTGTGVTAIVALTQAQYNALGTKNATTHYLIVG